ncbi:lipoprotein [Bdellovibrio bacteriovorus]|uniref:Lipoprotein n=1 Tax=Bdellovibrio bacteriovorus str. Tiberius TaxID=1069642 RepID=K7YT32_BDEBC|nr:lipoprotein [Bdellovibrio bacteriovorus]AFX99754.1 hypothetical protein Bdt_0041 [Bdellovibrio bacteriovorus str. Tiberius]
MEPLNKILLFAVLALAVSACGVKGRPLPPLNPAPLGRGEPTFKDANQAPNPKKKTIKKNQDDDTAAETEER